MLILARTMAKSWTPSMKPIAKSCSLDVNRDMAVTFCTEVSSQEKSVKLINLKEKRKPQRNGSEDLF